MKKLRGEVEPFADRHAKNPGWMTRKIPRLQVGNTVRFEISGHTFVGVVKWRRRNQLHVESNGEVLRISADHVTAILSSSLK